METALFISSTSGHRIVHVGAALGPQARGLHATREQVSVQPVGVAVAVLVELELHQRGLGANRQSWHDPRGGVRLLEVVDRALTEQLQHLFTTRPPVHVIGDRGPVVRLDQCGEGVDDVLRGRRVPRPPRSEPMLQLLLQACPYDEDERIRLRPVGHVLEPSVRQLVQGPQSHGGIFGVIAFHRHVDPGVRRPTVGRRPQPLEHPLAQAAARLREHHGGPVPEMGAGSRAVPRLRGGHDSQ